MSYFISLLAILIATLSLCHFTGKGIEVIFPITNLTVIAVLYVFGYFGALYAGGVTLLVLSLLAAAAAAVSIFRGRAPSMLRSLLSNYTVFIIAFAALQYAALRFMQVFSWDELTHWALVVKNMFFRGDFGGGEGATTMFPGYPVGSSLFLYFFEMFGTEFHPSHLYMAMNLATLSFIMPIVQPQKSFGRKLAATVTALGVIFVFNFTAFSSVWNDTFLAVLFSYIMTLYFTTKAERLPISSAIGITLASFVLTLAKSTGIAFVLFAYVIIALDALIIRNGGRRVKISPVFILAAFLAVLAARLSWSYYQSTAELGAAWDTEALTLGAVMDYVISPTEFQLEVTGSFILEFFLPIKYHGNGYHTPIPLVLVAVLIALMIRRIAKRSGERKYAISLGVGLGVTFFIYSVATLISYLFTFSIGEALSLASYVRYMNTFVIGALLLLVALLFLPREGEKPENAESSRSDGKLLLRLVAVMLVLSAIACPSVYLVMDGFLSPYGTYIDTVGSLEDNESIYQITVGDGNFMTTAPEEYLVMRFLATPIESSGLKKGGSPYVGDMWYAGMSAEDTLRAIADGGYTLIYLHRIDDVFIASHGKLFSSTPESFTFYRMGDGGKFERFTP